MYVVCCVSVPPTQISWLRGERKGSVVLGNTYRGGYWPGTASGGFGLKPPVEDTADPEGTLPLLWSIASHKEHSGNVLSPN